MCIHKKAIGLCVCVLLVVSIRERIHDRNMYTHSDWFTMIGAGGNTLRYV